MSVKIAVITDTHFGPRPTEHPQVRGDMADVLLLRAVHRLNRHVRPDITLVLGDMVDDGERAEAVDALAGIRATLDILESPYIVIPGNHDGDVDQFYSIFERPQPFLDINGARFAPFLDKPEPNHNASRSSRDIERMSEVRSGFDGPIVAVQHVPVFPPGASDSLYNHTNAPEIIAAMRSNGIGLAISGHEHEGIDLIRIEGASFVASAALCVAPFPFLEIDLAGDDIRVTSHELAMPEKLDLIDAHIHTQFAYCGENMEISRTITLARDLGLAGTGFSEHSGQLYFDAETYWSGECLQKGVESTSGLDFRMDGYFQALDEAGVSPENRGLEVDCDFSGSPIIRPEDRDRTAYLIGGVHVLPELRRPAPDLSTATEEFLATLGKFLDSGIKVLAHPFRVFRRARKETPEELFEPTIRLLKNSGVAAEINFHTNEPPPEFVKKCLESDVKLSFGSDAHNLYEIGEFAPHFALLKSCGFDGDLKDILA
ncbi:metallophosphoesterase [Candidatus Hydrogenedentota bacterium]